MSEELIDEAILTLDVLIDCTKEDGTYYNAQKEWEALEVFKKLQQENQQLKEIINNFHYCPYDDKCGELYDCSKEEYQGMVESNIKLANENSDLKSVLDEIREYIEEKEKDGTLWSIKATDGLLQILNKVKE